MKTLRFINLTGVHIYDHLRYEEILFRHTKQNWMIWNRGPVQPSIVLGYSGKVNELVNVNKSKQDGIPLIRRFTGGGTVIVDQSTIFNSFIMNADEAQTQPYPRNIMSWTESIYRPVFTRLTLADITKVQSLIHNLLEGV